MPKTFTRVCVFFKKNKCVKYHALSQVTSHVSLTPHSQAPSLAFTAPVTARADSNVNNTLTVPPGRTERALKVDFVTRRAQRRTAHPVQSAVPPAEATPEHRWSVFPTGKIANANANANAHKDRQRAPWADLHIHCSVMIICMERFFFCIYFIYIYIFRLNIINVFLIGKKKNFGHGITA